MTTSSFYADDQANSLLHTDAVRLSKLLSELPKKPGVYQMLARDGSLLYVGKAKNLINRVSSYFRADVIHPKTVALVRRIANIAVIITRSEVEALLLEQNLIKTHTPPYNINLRDDKSYMYIYLNKHAYPRITIGRRVAKSDIGHFFGPYPSGSKAKEAMTIIHKLFQLRSCDETTFKGRQRPCLEHQIKRCSAPCVGLVDTVQYQQQVTQAVLFLQGKTTTLTDSISSRMYLAAEAMQFEEAARLRDQLNMLSQLQSSQAVYQLHGEADIWAIAEKLGVLVVYALHIRGGRMLGGQAYYPDIPERYTQDCTLAETLAGFLSSYYFQHAQDFPAEIITSEALPNANELAEAISQFAQQKILCKHKVRETRAQWLSMALLNAQQQLDKKVAGASLLHHRFVQLEMVLGRSVATLEGFDISHTQGESTVASAVVCNRQGAHKKLYRTYNIVTAKAGDDYAAMREVLTRRYSKKTLAELPDVVLVDGGKGQLNIAIDVFSKLHPLYAGLVGLSKGEGRKAGLETLHLPNGTEIALGTDHAALHLLNFVRDESHRFARHHHTKKRDQKRGQSVLELIPKLGPVKRRALLTHFGGLQPLLSASEQDIAKVTGIGPFIARVVYAVLHE